MNIRPSSEADYDAFARLFPELKTGDAVPSRELFSREIVPRGHVIEEEGKTLGYAYVETFEGTGYVRHIVVAPEARGKKLGQTLMRHVADSLRRAGCSRWCLNVMPENEPALALYAAVGLKREYDSHVFRLDWDTVLPPSPPEIVATLSAREDDDALEAAFGLPRGSIASYRKSPSYVVLRLIDRRAPLLARVGFARFTPGFPGAFPFRLGDPSYARALLEGMRPYRLPQHTDVQLVTEDDEPLKQLLLDAGAMHRFAMQHLAGAL